MLPLPIQFKCCAPPFEYCVSQCCVLPLECCVSPFECCFSPFADDVFCHRNVVFHLSNVVVCHNYECCVLSFECCDSLFECCGSPFECLWFEVCRYVHCLAGEDTPRRSMSRPFRCFPFRRESNWWTRQASPKLPALCGQPSS